MLIVIARQPRYRARGYPEFRETSEYRLFPACFYRLTEFLRILDAPGYLMIMLAAFEG
jgi:hypothetical protein